MALGRICSKEGPLLIVAFVVAYCLQGCGIDPIVKVPCQEALTPVLTLAAVQAVDYAKDSCKKHYLASKPLAACISDATHFIRRAKTNVLNGNVPKCVAYVEKELCPYAEACDVITPTKAYKAATAWAQKHIESGAKALRKQVEANIEKSVQQHYDRAFYTRMVPDTVIYECGLEISSKLRAEDTLAAQKIVFTTCKAKIPKTAVHEIIKCNAEGQKEIVDAKEKWISKYARLCGKIVLDELCPKKSNCAIDTSEVDLLKAVFSIRKYVAAKSTKILQDLSQAYLLTARKFVPSYIRKFFPSYIPHQLYELVHTTIKYRHGYVTVGMSLLLATVAIAGFALYVRRQRQVSGRLLGVAREETELEEQLE